MIPAHALDEGGIARLEGASRVLLPATASEPPRWSAKNTVISAGTPFAGAPTHKRPPPDRPHRFDCSVAWVILGSTLVYRSDSGALTSEVHALWGPPRRQHPPRGLFRETRRVMERVTNYDAQGRPVPAQVEREQVIDVPIPLAASDITTRLALEHRRKGLYWFPICAVAFRGTYAFLNDSALPRTVEMSFPLEGDSVVYDGFDVLDHEGQRVTTTIQSMNVV